MGSALRHLFLLAAFALCRASADDIAGPLMGYVPDVATRAIRPIRGLPGSASLGDAVPFEGDIVRMEVSPAQDAVLLWGESALRIGTLIPDAPPELSPAALPAEAAASLGAFSAGGRNLALLDSHRSTVYLFPMRSGRAGEMRPLDLPIGDAHIASLAVSDADEPVVAGIVDGESPAVFVADLSGNYRSITDLQRPASLTFLGGTGDLAVADAGAAAVLRISNPFSGAAPEPLYAEGLSGDGMRLASSPDGRTLIVLDSTRTIRSLDLRSGTATSIECDCSPGNPQGLRGRSVFRLTDAVDRPVWILDAGFGDPRLLFVPAAVQDPSVP